uniref:probable protein phosphatase 2C 23 n=1 Tax=Erigeron canadensis TaxID=72917 RepID=UPI001CB89F22|nr:probable protein phosphatase 2C 23 [Erigeron canadensis]
MGNGVGKLTVCFTGPDIIHRRKHLTADIISDPVDDLGHSFIYRRPDPSQLSSSKVHSADETTTFKSISGASVSANTSTPLSTSFLDVYSYNIIDKASAIESSTSFTSGPLHPLPRNSINSGPLPGPGAFSGPIDNPFLSGPIDRGFLSGPLFSGPLDHFQRSYSHSGYGGYRNRSRKRNLIRGIKRAISKTFTISARGQGSNSSVAPISKNVGFVKDNDWVEGGNEKVNELTVSSINLSSEGSYLDDDECLGQGQNLQWAQGKAGEDRVHVVVSEEHGWVFVGIYDGFNGPDAPDYLVSHMYSNVYKELKGLLWDDDNDNQNDVSNNNDNNSTLVESLDVVDLNSTNNEPRKNSLHDYELESYPSVNEDFEINLRKKKGKIRKRGAAKKREENQRRWKCEFDRERLELDRRLREHMNTNGSNSINPSDVLKALSQGLKKTEEGFLDIADQMLVENPELALMGSCVLVMLMKGEDVYVMNVGDSRAVLAQKSEPDIWGQDLEKINEETWYDLEVFEADIATTNSSLTACQLSIDHSTSIEEEVQRVKSEHPDDACAVMNDRVKGSLKVTRAFGAGFLKQPKWNNALLEMFRIDYVGTAPYINCHPYLHHHKLGPRDRFLILSSDGLYQYFTNEEAVSEVELFIQWSPEGDPAQHLVEEVLLRAAKKAGIDFHELLEIPQGDRRRYHDDVSIIVISLEGRIWRSCV